MGAYDDILNDKPKRGSYDDILEAQPAQVNPVLQQDKNVLGGLIRGAGSIGSTLIYPYDRIKGGGREEGLRLNRERRASIDEGLQNLIGSDPESIGYKTGKIGSEIMGTAGVGSVLAKGVPFVSNAPAAVKFANALKSGGFSTGAPASLTQLGRAGDMGIRMAGGGVLGGASAGMVDPESYGTGAVIGAALPPTMAGAGKVMHAVGRGVRAVATPARATLANTVLDAAEARTPQQIAALREQLNRHGPSMLPDSPQTVPQLLQRPGVSQLQRTVKSAGDTRLLDIEAMQNAARLRGLNRISPVTGTVQQSAENFGKTLEDFAFPAKAAAKKYVSGLYESPVFDDARMYLPIDEMQAAKAKYLGAGTFGAGNAADTAIDTAINESTLKAANAQGGTAKGARSLLDDIKALGGIERSNIRDITGEGKVGKGVKGLPPNLFKGSGTQLDELANKLRAMGYDIADDVDGGVENLRDLIRQELDGEKVYTLFDMEDVAMLNDAAKYAPKPQGPTEQAVPFRTIQNLRSSIGDAAQEATKGSRNQEAAALKAMRSAIDSNVDNIVENGGRAGENFSPEAMSAWLKANLAHKERIARFDTGPQKSMFRMGSDGVPVSQGGELANKFFNASRSQADDARSFNKLIAGDVDTAAALKNYAVTDAANQTNRFGELSNSKFSNWIDGRSGAIRETFNPSDRAMMETIRRELYASDAAESLGKASGSNTVQNAQNALKNGLLESPVVDLLANKTPFLNQVTGPMLRALRESASKTKAAELGGLLADPAALDAAIAQYLMMQRTGLLGAGTWEAGQRIAPSLYRAAPVLAADR
jgi:hypothetical protein